MTKEEQELKAACELVEARVRALQETNGVKNKWFKDRAIVLRYFPLSHSDEDKRGDWWVAHDVLIMSSTGNKSLYDALCTSGNNAENTNGLCGVDTDGMEAT